MELLVHAPFLAICAVLFLVVYFVRVVFLSPLSKIPSAHWSSSFSSAWILWQRWQGCELPSAVEAHRKLGPIVKLGPKDLSVTCYDEGIRKVYGGGFDKPVYYDFFGYYGTSNSFCSRTRQQHAMHRRRMSTPYTKSSLFNSVELTAMTRRTLYERLLPRLQHESKVVAPTEMLELSYALCLDLVTQFIFGFSNASNFLQAPQAETIEWLDHYERRYCKESFWSQEMPLVHKMLTSLGVDLMPAGHVESTEWLESWMMEMCDGAERTLHNKSHQPEDAPLVFEPVYSASKKEYTPSDLESRRKAIASELFDHMSGAREVLGLVLAYTIFYIARHPTAQQTLREELVAAQLDMRWHGEEVTDSSGGKMPSPQAMDKLPYMSAVLKESLRMRPNSTPLPRVTPKDRSVTLAGYDNIPPETRVNSFQWFVHRDPTKWDAADEWRPERWLEDHPSCESSEAIDSGEARLWAFGSGPRICVGLHLTHYLMRYILAAIFGNFQVTVADYESFGKHTPGSLEDKLWLKFEPLKV
ncbi:cytochrome P450 [Poronia punctata]|nr:cytochrome P450 [Poronia punctata]